MSKHVAVLMGGWSAEREISLRSGKACAEALARLGHRVTRIDVGRDIAAVLTTSPALLDRYMSVARKIARRYGTPIYRQNGKVLAQKPRT